MSEGTARRGCVEPLPSGRACGGLSLAEEKDGQVRCLAHARDPARIRRRQERDQAGGLARLRVWNPATTAEPDLSDVAGIRAFLRKVIRGVVVGELGEKPAKVAIMGLHVAVRLGELELSGVITELERKLEQRIPARLR